MSQRTIEAGRHSIFIQHVSHETGYKESDPDIINASHLCAQDGHALERAQSRQLGEELVLGAREAPPSSR